MSHLNNFQKIIVAFSFVMFFVVNVTSFILILPKLKQKFDDTNKSKESAEIQIIVKLASSNGATETLASYRPNELISVQEGNIITEIPGKAFIASIGPFQAIVDEDGAVNIIKGVSYLSIFNNITLDINKGKVNLEPGFIGIHSPDDSLLLNVRGIIEDGHMQVLPNYYLSWEVDTFNSYAFDRKSLVSSEAYSNLLDLVRTLGVIPDELSDLKPPTIVVSSPLEGQSTVEASVIFSVETEVGAKLKINDEEIVVNSDGFSSMPFSLKLGNNNFVLTAWDKFGNKSTKQINVYRNEARAISPASYPLSYFANQ